MTLFNKFNKKNNINNVLIVIILLMSIFLVNVAQKVYLNDKNPPEITQILNHKWTAEQRPHLIKLLDRVGPVKTQEYLYASELPFTSENHLLAHTIGEYIYKKYGTSGLKLCKDYFQSACYHAFIIEDLSDHGMEGLSKSLDDCQKAGLSVFDQCSHAAGHGFVVWKDYNLISALSSCDGLFVKKANNRSLFSCRAGVFMENILSVHEGKLSDKRWVKADDSYYPCNDPRIDSKYLSACWSMQAARMYQMYPGDWKKIAQRCDEVENIQYQKICYDSFARQIHPYTFGNSGKAFRLCGKATGEKWQNFCLLALVRSSIDTGDKKMPYEICHSIKKSERDNCYDKLFVTIWARTNKNTINELCSYVKESEYKLQCLNFEAT